MTTFTTKMAVDVEVRELGCGHFAAMSPEQWKNKYRDGSDIRCPFGETVSYQDNENAQLRKQLVEEQARVAAISGQHAQALKERNALLDERNRLTKRIKNGVCIECHRTFKQLARHMKTKHGMPKEKAAAIAGAVH